MHHQALAQLARITASGEPPLESLAPHDARRTADERVMNNGWPLLTLPVISPLTLPGPGGPLAARLYKSDPTAIRPLILFFHGGGFMVGNLDTHDALCRTLAARTEATVLSIGYRLAPENRFPAAPDDCLFAANWAYANAHALGIDPNRIAAVGESSGGNLVAGVAQAGAAGKAPPLVQQVMIYPSLDMRLGFPSYQTFAHGYFFTLSKAQYFKDHYLNTDAEATDPRASPLRGIIAPTLPPALIIAAELDPLVDEAVEYARRLRAAGVSVSLDVYDGWPHGFMFWAHTEAAQRAMDSSVAALRQAFGAGSVDV